MKHIWIAALLIVAVGCHAQVPPASVETVVLTWNAPVANSNWLGCGTGQPTCTYAIYRATGSTCPVSTSTAWTEVTNPASRPTALTWTDTTATGAVCYIAETVQSGLNSGPSNTVSLTVPAVPTAPALGTPTTADLVPVKPTSSSDLVMAMAIPLRLTARLTR